LGGEAGGALRTNWGHKKKIGAQAAKKKLSPPNHRGRREWSNARWWKAKSKDREKIRAKRGRTGHFEIVRAQAGNAKKAREKNNGTSQRIVSLKKTKGRNPRFWSGCKGWRQGKTEDRN